MSGTYVCPTLSWNVIGSYATFSGITDDDLRETAYEILVAAAGASG